MRILQELRLQFENRQWCLDPDLALIDTILEKHLEIYELVRGDLADLNKDSAMGRQDSPSVEQIVRAAIFKEMKGLDYRGLEYAQGDSRICEIFIKLEQRRPFSFEVLHKYISKIKPETLKKVLVVVNKVALEEGIEDLEKLRMDSTVVESNIHHPTNNSLIWDCIRESQRLLEKLKGMEEGEGIIDYTKQAKSNHFQINMAKGEEKTRALFEKQLRILKRSIRQTEGVFKKLVEKKGKKGKTSGKMAKVREELGKLLPLMKKVGVVPKMSERREIRGEKVPNAEKVYSIYEAHTDIIVKGAREVEFGHKVNISGGQSSLVLWCEVVDGNPADTTLFGKTLKDIKEQYAVTPRDIVTDGGYASLANLKTAQDEGVLNVVFNKIVGSLKNVTTSLNMETRLKKWRSGVEAMISNIKRGFGIRRCIWKGRERFEAKVLWSVLGYNIRVMTQHFLRQIVLSQA